MSLARRNLTAICPTETCKLEVAICDLKWCARRRAFETCFFGSREIRSVDLHSGNLEQPFGPSLPRVQARLGGNRALTPSAMSKERFVERQVEVGRAAQRLLEAVAVTESELVRDAVIQRFEFSFELVWKTLKL